MNLVIFDCDGTLVDSAAAIVSTMETAFLSQGQTPPTPTAVRNAIGLSLEVCISRLTEDVDLVPAIAQAYRDTFNANGQASAHGLFSGAMPAILDLAKRDNYLLGIATGKSRRGLDALLEHHQLTTHFQTTKTADDAPSKPHPGMIEMCMKEAGVGPQETLVIGDTTYDMEMATAAGAVGMGVSWGSHDAMTLLAAGAHSVVFDFPRLVPAVDSYFSERS